MSCVDAGTIAVGGTIGGTRADRVHMACFRFTETAEADYPLGSLSRMSNRAAISALVEWIAAEVSSCEGRVPRVR